MPFVIRKGWAFPIGTWIENIAVRSNGQQLLTFLSTPGLYLLNLDSPDTHPELVYGFPNVQALTGIAEIAPDVFAVIAGNYTLASGPRTGSWAVWRVDLTGWSTASSNDTLTLAASHVSKIADIPEATYLKGMSQLSDRYVLLSDVRVGLVYRLDVNTGAYTVVIVNSRTLAYQQPLFGLFGVNGLHVRDGYLYFTNTGQNILAKIPIKPDGTPTGPASIVARTRAPADYFDGFTFGARGDVYLGTGSGNTVVRIPQSGGPQVTIAGSLNSWLVAEPTNCAFGRGVTDRGVLYVVTAGGALAPPPGRVEHGGMILAIEVETGS